MQVSRTRSLRISLFRANVSFRYKSILGIFYSNHVTLTMGNWVTQVFMGRLNEISLYDWRKEVEFGFMYCNVISKTYRILSEIQFLYHIPNIKKAPSVIYLLSEKWLELSGVHVHQRELFTQNINSEAIWEEKYTFSITARARLTGLAMFLTEATAPVASVSPSMMILSSSTSPSIFSTAPWPTQERFQFWKSTFHTTLPIKSDRQTDLQC